MTNANRIASVELSEALGAMHGEHAFQATAMCVLTGAYEIEGIQRTMIGGCLVGPDIMGDCLTWQRWRGQMIFVPTSIEVAQGSAGHRIDQMMTGPMNYDLGQDDWTGKENFWKHVWKAT